jgi:protein gp37
MGEASKIEWTHHTLNPWRGCTKATWTDSTGKVHLHPGCLNCYAEKDMSVKLHGIHWGKGQERRPKAESGWGEPLAWARNAAKAGERHRVFCASLADVLDDEGLPEMRERLWDTVRRTAAVWPESGRPAAAHYEPDRIMRMPGLDWLLLTKRPENWRWIPEDVRPLVWLGTSVSDQETADEWVPRLLQAEGFRYRFLSVEPLVGAVDLWRSWLRVPEDAHSRAQHVGSRIDWVIVGGESGSKARPCNVEWIRDIIRQCREAGVPCFVKQVGAAYSDPVDGVAGRSLKVPEEASPLLSRRLTDPKGGDWNEWPMDLRVREFPGRYGAGGGGTGTG